jgi:hypothetical protein
LGAVENGIPRLGFTWVRAPPAEELQEALRPARRKPPFLPGRLPSSPQTGRPFRLHSCGVHRVL